MMKSKNLWKNKTLGISIFPNRDDYKKIIDYLELAKSFGIERVFTNLIGLSREELDNFTKICKKAKDIGMQMIIDIDKDVCDKFNITIDDTGFFEKMGAYGIRLDVKFDAEKIARLSRGTNLVYEINASDFSGLDKEISEHDFNANQLVASHNFFPQLLTGLSIEKFSKANNLFKKISIKTSAFVTINRSKAISAWKEAKGTPTLEIFRKMQIHDQIQFLLNRDDIDYIMVSDMYLLKSDMEAISFLKENHIVFNRNIIHENDNELKILNFDGHKIRGDNPDDIMLRSTISRKIFKNLSIVPRKYEKKYFQKGSVLILNNLAGRYKGELHVLKQDIPYSSDKNLVGTIDENQLNLLKIKNKIITFEFKENNLFMEGRKNE